jgi:hypothetical protein
MSDTWSVIKQILGWANIALEEAETMSDSQKIPKVVKTDVKTAHEAIERLVQYKDEALHQAFTDAQYKALVQKLQANNIPITSDILKGATDLNR